MTTAILLLKRRLNESQGKQAEKTADWIDAIRWAVGDEGTEVETALTEQRAVKMPAGREVGK